MRVDTKGFNFPCISIHDAQPEKMWMMRTCSCSMMYSRIHAPKCGLLDAPSVEVKHVEVCDSNPFLHLLLLLLYQYLAGDKVVPTVSNDLFPEQYKIGEAMSFAQNVTS